MQCMTPAQRRRLQNYGPELRPASGLELVSDSDIDSEEFMPPLERCDTFDSEVSIYYEIIIANAEPVDPH